MNVEPSTEAGGALQAVQTSLTGVDDKPTRDHITKLRAEIAQALKHDEGARKGYEDDRRVARGLNADGKPLWEVRTNLVQTIIEILMAFTYAKDPDISAAVAQSVGESRALKYAPMVETLEVVISRLLKKAGLKKKAKKLVRQAMTVGIAWMAAAMQTRTEKDQQVQNEINDLKQQLDLITTLKAELAAGQSCADYDAKQSQLNANMVALQAKAERTIALGLVLEVFDCNDVIVSAQVGMLEDYLDAPWITKNFYKSEDQVRALTGWNKVPGQIDPLANASRFRQRPRGDNDLGNEPKWVQTTDSSAQTLEGFFLVQEMWHKDDGVVYTMVAGVADRWAKAPYAPRQSSRFYDLFRLAFHDIDGDRHPQSDVHMLKDLQDEYSSVRSNFREHRKRAIPATFFNSNVINEEEARKFKQAEIGEYVPLNAGEADGDMSKLFYSKEYPQFDPRLYDTQAILTDIEKVSGAQDAMQSSVAVEKTATEAEIQNNGFGARVGVRKDALEDLLTDLAQHVGEIAMQTCDEAYVRRLAGEDAIWPALSIDEIMYGFDIEVQAGSTGKPNAAAQRNAWATLMPLIEKLITVIGNHRAAGNEWAAAPYVALLKETFRRMGERMDVQKFLPQPPLPAVDPVTGQPIPAGGAVDPETGAPAPAMAPALNAPGGANVDTPPPAAAPPTV